MKIKQQLLQFAVACSIFGCQNAEEGPFIPASIEEPSIMILGVYHFNNPAQDAYNIIVDDYLSEKRQDEIKEVIRSLKEYKPTKIYVEINSERQSHIDSLYALYLDHKISLSDIDNGVNEVYQIGFRLGKELGGIEVKAMDHPGVWLGDYVDFIADTLRLDFYQKRQLRKREEIKEREKIFQSNSIKKNLIYLNERQQLKRNHEYYNNVAIRVKDTAGIVFSNQTKELEIDGLLYFMRSYDFNNIGIELVVEWYRRNLHIYRNILENTEMNDRILLVIGSGHVFYLNELLCNNSKYQIIHPNQYLLR